MFIKLVFILFIRHGDSGWDPSMIEKGYVDLSLTPLGINTVLNNSHKLPVMENPLIISSTLKRAKETADILFPNNEKHYDSRLNEMNHFAETEVEFNSRVMDMLKDFTYNPGDNLVLVSHQGVLNILSKKLVGKELSLKKGEMLLFFYNNELGRWQYNYL